jgi:type IV pilus assembly protein PilB
MARKRLKLGEILVQHGALTPDALEEGLKSAAAARKRLGDALIEAGSCDDTAISKALAEQTGLPFVDLNERSAAQRIDLNLVPDDLRKRFKIVPLGEDGGRLHLAIGDPMALDALDMLRFRLNRELVIEVASPSAIEAALDGNEVGGGRNFDGQSFVTDSIDASVDSSVDRSVDKSIDVDAGEDSRMVTLVNRIIEEAVRNRASDIHIEPMPDRVVLRYRIDGVCTVRDNLPKRMQAAVLARLKLMAGINIAEKRIPQDGRIKLKVDESQIDFRVSSCPAYHGESIVLRILRPDSVQIGLANLGFEPDHLDIFNRVIRRPNGIFLVTGPTGSGKTTTLYTALDELNRPDKKIITAEDPVEYNFKGINQCQVRESIGFTFASILRSMLRQAPNVILVGEIRDREVAEIAIQAALTGHLVFSTLHTNDAPSAITRLIDMGVKPFLVASSIQAIMAQRLVRVLCKHCKAPAQDLDPKELQLIGIDPDSPEVDQIMGPVGCPKCENIGFKGRRAIFEFMKMNSEVRDLAFQRAPAEEIRAVAIRTGMRTLVDDGRLKTLAGSTTPAEVARFAQAEFLTSGNVDI